MLMPSLCRNSPYLIHSTPLAVPHSIPVVLSVENRALINHIETLKIKPYRNDSSGTLEAMAISSACEAASDHSDYSK